MFSKSPPKVRNLTIHVETGATIGPKGLPLVYGNPDSLTILHAVINFETSHDCKAKGVEILFKAATHITFSGTDTHPPTRTHTHTNTNTCAISLFVFDEESTLNKEN